ncbi:hypothetical protein MUK42_32818 [Musa troglodytarum]|uniref:Uncharacterized protein n=1 Tax=Musa troglodytarum TaxID=320322 RepID=A0A9E7G7L0_9LILI|nr:hypothetical protein MUK42_32818 [Musa troglodytarum]
MMPCCPLIAAVPMGPRSNERFEMRWSNSSLLRFFWVFSGKSFLDISNNRSVGKSRFLLLVITGCSEMHFVLGAR